MLSTEELLRPRIICTEDYMDNIFGVGQQIPLQWNESFNDWEYVDCSRHILMSHFLQFEQFIILEWWEERTVDDLPEYFKFYDGTVIKVVKWEINSIGVLYSHIEWIEQGEKVINDNQCFKSAMPATSEEYLQQNTLVK